MGGNLMQRNLILAVDPSTRVVGWGLLDAAKPGKPVRLESGIIEAGGGSRFGHYRSIRFSVRALITKHGPGVMAIESGVLFLNEKQNIDTAFAQAEARGVIMGLAFDHDMDLAAYTPTQVKKAATGKGNSKKPIVQRMIAAIFKLHFVYPDEADALAVGLAHCNRLEVERVGALPQDPMAGTFWASSKGRGEE